MTQDDILLLPDPTRSIEAWRDTGYDFNMAVADILDNSIAAEAKNISILLDKKLHTDEFYLYVADDGTGMDEEGLIDAMRYGSRERPNRKSLGKFGFGLKTASTSFCRRLGVVSRGSDNIVRKVQWDLDHVAEKGDWMLERPDPMDDETEYLDETASSGTGTLVIWEKIDRLFKSRNPKKQTVDSTIESLKFHVAMTFQRFLDKNDQRENNVNITINGSSILPWDPFCESEKLIQTPYESNEVVELPDGTSSHLFIRARILPRKEDFSSSDAAKAARIGTDMLGFYIYRENRLIHHGGWLRMFTSEPHTSLLRVELSFDYTLDEAFKIDVKKSRIILDDEIYDYIRNQILPRPRKLAEDYYRKGQSKGIKDIMDGNPEPGDSHIDTVAPNLPVPPIKIQDPDTGKVIIENENGSISGTIRIHHPDPEKLSKYRIIPVESIEDGLLWEPVATEPTGTLGIRINQNHPFYQKIYFPFKEQNVIIIGIDSLLWAMSDAELSTYKSEDTKEIYENMRFIVSRDLRMLVKDLPEPKIPEDEET